MAAAPAPPPPPALPRPRPARGREGRPRPRPDPPGPAPAPLSRRDRPGPAPARSTRPNASSEPRAAGPGPDPEPRGTRSSPNSESRDAGPGLGAELRDTQNSSNFEPWGDRPGPDPKPRSTRPSPSSEARSARPWPGPAQKPRGSQTSPNSESRTPPAFPHSALPSSPAPVRLELGALGARFPPYPPHPGRAPPSTLRAWPRPGEDRAQSSRDLPKPGQRFWGAEGIPSTRCVLQPPPGTGRFGGRNRGSGRIPACGKHGEGGRARAPFCVWKKSSSGVSWGQLGGSWLCWATGAVALGEGAGLGAGKGAHPMSAPRNPRDPRAWQPPWLSRAGAGLGIPPSTPQTRAAPGLGDAARPGWGLATLGGSPGAVNEVTAGRPFPGPPPTPVPLLTQGTRGPWQGSPPKLLQQEVGDEGEHPHPHPLPRFNPQHQRATGRHAGKGGCAFTQSCFIYPFVQNHFPRFILQSHPWQGGERGPHKREARGRSPTPRAPCLTSARAPGWGAAVGRAPAG